MLFGQLLLRQRLIVHRNGHVIVAPPDHEDPIRDYVGGLLVCLGVAFDKGKAWECIPVGPHRIGCALEQTRQVSHVALRQGSLTAEKQQEEELDQVEDPRSDGVFVGPMGRVVHMHRAATGGPFQLAFFC